MLRNLERLQLDDDASRHILTILWTLGRDKALLALRIKMLIWIRDHAAVQILPRVSLADLIRMETGLTLEEYVNRMRRPQE